MSGHLSLGENLFCLGFAVVSVVVVRFLRRNDGKAPEGGELTQDPDAGPILIRLIRKGQLLGAIDLHALRSNIDRETATAEISRLFLGQGDEPPLAPALPPDVRENLTALLKAGEYSAAHKAYRAATGGDDLAARLAVDQLKASL
jgi:hypothetical protein